jgi:uncharacterized protein YggE
MRQLFIAALLVFCAAAGLADAQPLPPNIATLTVAGHGRTKVPPDRANLTVDVVTNGKTLEAATAAHRERAERALRALRDLQGNGLKVERSTFRLNQVHPPVNPASGASQAKTEYQAATTFDLTLTRLEAIDATVTAIAATGLFEVRNIVFEIGDRNPGLKTARKDAIDDAKAKAATYADAAGVQLGDILRIEDNGDGGPPQFAAAPMLRSSVKVIPPETLTLSASVTMTWRIAPSRNAGQGSRL